MPTGSLFKVGWLRSENAIQNIILSTIFFAIMNVIVKYLDEIPFFELVFFRALVSVVLGYGVLRAKKVSIIPKNPKMMLARGLTGTGSLVLYFYTLQNMPLASAVTIQHLSPLFTVILGALIFRESTTRLQWFFLITSFGGVLLVKGFDTRIEWSVLGIGMMAALCSGFTYNLIRKMRDSEPSIRIIMYFPLITLILVTPFVVQEFVVPTWQQLCLLIFLGFDTYVAQYFMTKAYQGRAPGYISIFNYLGVFYASILGYFLFNEKLSLLACLGILIIILSVVLSTLMSKKEKNVVAP